MKKKVFKKNSLLLILAILLVTSLVHLKVHAQNFPSSSTVRSGGANSTGAPNTTVNGQIGTGNNGNSRNGVSVNIPGVGNANFQRGGVSVSNQPAGVGTPTNQAAGNSGVRRSNNGGQDNQDFDGGVGVPSFGTLEDPAQGYDYSSEENNPNENSQSTNMKERDFKLMKVEDSFELSLKNFWTEELRDFKSRNIEENSSGLSKMSEEHLSESF